MITNLIGEVFDMTTLLIKKADNKIRLSVVREFHSAETLRELELLRSGRASTVEKELELR